LISSKTALPAQPRREPAAAATAPSSSRQPPETRGSARLAVWLFAFGLLVYAATRLLRLTDFPIFFFTDEAIQANTAQSLFTHHFRDSQGVLLPPYFLNDMRWAMSLNIYLLVLPVVLFGKSVLVTRGTFVLVSLLGAAAAGAALKVMRSRAWWTPPLLLAAMPIDFLHSRVAFETTPACLAGFLCAYLLYRLRSPRYFWLAILLGAATFYSYTAGQGIMLVLGVLLTAVDFRYHLQAFRGNRRMLAAALLLLVLVAVPFLREQRRHPRTTREQLLVLHSYWITPGPLTQKLGIFGATYLQAFRPVSWFQPTGEAVRHRMKGMAYVPPAYVPLLVLGIASALWNWRRSPGHRAILFSPIAVPFAAAADQLQILRVLPMVVPIVLLSALGADELLRRVRRPLLAGVFSTTCAVVLAGAAGQMTGVALRDGPTWYPDYGLYGMQYGARQIFHVIREELARNPSTRVFLSSTWANNPDPFIDFFLTPQERARTRMGDVDGYLMYRTPLADNFLFVVTPEQYQVVVASPKVVVSPPERTIPYPDGRTGFYVVRMRYSANADEIFVAEREARRRLVEETVQIGKQPVLVRHSVLDMGTAELLFDGRPDTTFRGLEANPLVVEFLFPAPRRISRVGLTIGGMDCAIRLEVTPDKGDPVVLTRTVRKPPGDTLQEFVLPGGVLRAVKVRLEVKDLLAGELAHVELREIAFQ
jgi:hypothetical protein